jgi:hypothetical protein
MLADGKGALAGAAATTGAPCGPAGKSFKHILGPWTTLFKELPAGSQYDLARVVTIYMQLLVFLEAYHDGDMEAAAKVVNSGWAVIPSEPQKNAAWKQLLKLVLSKTTSEEYQDRHEA